MSTSTALARSKFQAFGLLPIAATKIEFRKCQLTCNTNMSDYSCGVIKLA